MRTLSILIDKVKSKTKECSWYGISDIIGKVMNRNTELLILAVAEIGLGKKENKVPRNFK